MTQLTTAEALAWAASHGLWDILQLSLQLSVVVVGAKLLFWPRRRIRQLDFRAEPREYSPQFPRVAVLHIQNYTGSSIVLSHPYFRIQTLRRHPTAAEHAATDEVQLKFPDSSGTQFSEVEVLLRNKESTHTLVPFHPDESLESIRKAIGDRELGAVECYVTWLTRKPSTERLRTRL